MRFLKCYRWPLVWLGWKVRGKQLKIIFYLIKRLFFLTYQRSLPSVIRKKKEQLRPSALSCVVFVITHQLVLFVCLFFLLLFLSFVSGPSFFQSDAGVCVFSTQILPWEFLRVLALDFSLSMLSFLLRTAEYEHLRTHSLEPVCLSSGPYSALYIEVWPLASTAFLWITLKNGDNNSAFLVGLCEHEWFKAWPVLRTMPGT